MPAATKSASAAPERSLAQRMEALNEAVFLYLREDEGAPGKGSNEPPDRPSLRVDEVKLCVPA